MVREAHWGEYILVIRVLFFGTPEFSAPTLKGLIEAPNVKVSAVITQPDRPVGRGRALTPPPIKQIAEAHSIPVFQPTSLKKEFSEIRKSLDQYGPFTVGIVIAFGQLLPAEVLSYPDRGCVNIHASLLPRWRGAAPIHRAIEAGDRETGVCLMQMDEGLDTGAVYSTATTPIGPNTTALQLQETLSSLGSALLQRDLLSIVNGSISAVQQNTAGITYAKKVSSEEAKIDWSQSNQTISDKIRAFYPFPGCHTRFQNKRLKILQASPIDSNLSPHSPLNSNPPGSVIESDNGRLLVLCGEGQLRVDRVKLEGKREMDISEFLRGTAIPNGLTLK
jgi:methionyl-tRNA formyltransferase